MLSLFVFVLVLPVLMLLRCAVTELYIMWWCGVDSTVTGDYVDIVDGVTAIMPPLLVLLAVALAFLILVMLLAVLLLYILLLIVVLLLYILLM